MYGWLHREAGARYSSTELSFRQTIHATEYSDRGFTVKIDRESERILISFDASKVSSRHKIWLESVERRIGVGELDPQSYWGFSDLEHNLGVKLQNCFYVQADAKREKGIQQYWYRKVQLLQRFNFSGFLNALELGLIFIDFDARSTHNHGTKFRTRQKNLPLLYTTVETIIDL